MPASSPHVDRHRPRIRRDPWSVFQERNRELIVDVLVAERVLSQSLRDPVAARLYRNDRLPAAEAALQAAVLDFSVQAAGPDKAIGLSRDLLLHLEHLFTGHPLEH